MGRAMVRLGWDMHFTRYNKDVDLAAAEIDARRERLGIWSDPDAPLPPWERRKSEKVTEE